MIIEEVKDSTDIGKCDKNSPDYIPVKEKISYGLGSLMDGGGVALMSCVMLRYMTNALGIAIGVASTIMMLSKAWDAISDPLMGIISDGTKSKYGRRKPYMFVGGILLIVAIFLLFMPIGGMSLASKTAYILIMYLFWNTCSTIAQVPYTSMASDISPDFRERNNANTIKLVFNAVSSGVAYVVPLLLLESYLNPNSSMTATKFWLIIASVFGFLFGGGLIQSSIFVKERIKISPTHKKEKFNVATYVEPFRNKSFKWHIVMYVSAFMCMDIIAALALYYAGDVWRGQTLMGKEFSSMFIIAPIMVSAVIAFPLVRYLMDKKSKQFAFRMGLPLYIISGVMLAVMDPAWAPSYLVPIVAVLMGFGFGGAQMMPWIIFPDTVDIAELKLGTRPTGNYSGIMTLVRKLAGAMGVWVVGLVLGVVGYIESTSDITIIQNTKVLLWIRLLLGGSIAILITIGFFASFQYKVDNRKLTRVRYFIDRKNSGTLSSMTQSEKDERLELVMELAGLTVLEQEAYVAEMNK